VVLELPSTSIPPAELSWLPRLRSTDEAEADLVASFEAAVEPVGQLIVLVNKSLDVLADEEGAEAGWVIHEVAARAANEELQITARSVSVASVGEGDAHWRVRVRGASDVFEIGDTGTGHLLERLSAGQQRWADEAFATMSNMIRRFGMRAEVFSMAVHRLSAEHWQQAKVALAEVIEAVRMDQYWSFDHFDAVLRELEPLLLAAATEDRGTQPRMQRILNALAPQYEVLRPRSSVRVFDEPEAHLHPREQRRIARALDRLRLRGDNVVIASHSPTFLDVPSWRPLHVAGGRVFEVLDLEAPARTGIARDLGATRGDLLAGISALLIVEGTHDQLVLDTWFGPQLRAAGVVTIPMRGTEHLSSVLALDFVHRFMDVPPTIMLDFTDAARVRNGTGKTREERKLVELIEQARERGFEFKIIGLRQPDIVCYLNGTAVQRLFPTFPGWETVIEQFKRLRPRPAFKTWLFEKHEVDLHSTAAIAAVLEVMVHDHLPPVGQLHQEISALLATLHDDVE
jgi:energy-coupling factor transporter ATP-binding protein EcfA2